MPKRSRLGICVVGSLAGERLTARSQKWATSERKEEAQRLSVPRNLSPIRVQQCENSVQWNSRGHRDVLDAANDGYGSI